ncbi:hypothetical protein SAMN07250955_11658 [Arboricoccus pini]|uniref:Uncharacterized protein n=1 Tax=Arboricoccus pini TaxID=1963835 RepID=A0A212RX24_9PROT|nr:hypothetical protein SAMN07250955_11658 [Arboricoccus pini]
MQAFKVEMVVADLALARLIFASAQRAKDSMIEAHRVQDPRFTRASAARR